MNIAMCTHTRTHETSHNTGTCLPTDRKCLCTLYYNQLTPTPILLPEPWQADHNRAVLAIWQQTIVPTIVVFEYISVK
jgi:hypothetical protein